MPSVSCQAPSTITPGGSATVQAVGTSPINGNLREFFLVSAGSITVNGVTTPTGAYSAIGSTGTLNTTGVASGTSFWVFCQAQDDFGQTASSYATVTVSGASAAAATAATVATDNTGEQALTAFQFTDSVGVNLHLHLSNTAYVTQFPLVLQTLQASGIKHYRNSLDPYPYPWEFPNAEALGLAGIKADWLIDPRLNASQINAISQNAPDSLEVFEGPNEDDSDVGPVLTNFMQFLQTTVRSNPTTASEPIYAPTVALGTSIPLMGNLSPYITDGNMHDYYNPRYPETPAYGGTVYGCAGYGSLAFNLCLTQISAPGLPVVSTETGYVSGVVPDTAIGRYLPRILFMHLGASVMRTYFYELLDEPNTPNYGLLRSDFSAKPAYTAITNLISLFSDSAFSTPGKLNFTITGNTANVNHVLFQKSDGTYMIAIWLGVSSATWPTTDYTVQQTLLYPTPQTVSIQTASSTGNATIYSLDDSGNMSSSSVSTFGNVTTLPVTDRITVVALKKQ